MCPARERTVFGPFPLRFEDAPCCYHRVVEFPLISGLASSQECLKFPVEMAVFSLPEIQPQDDLSIAKQRLVPAGPEFRTSRRAPESRLTYLFDGEEELRDLGPQGIYPSLAELGNGIPPCDDRSHDSSNSEGGKKRNRYRRRHPCAYENLT